MREFYKAVIGQKSRNYYLAKFEVFDKQGIGLKPSWNWSALFATGVWALYRKMYGWFFAWCGVVSLSSIFEKSGSPVVSGLIVLVATIVFSAYANSLYHNKVKTRIAVAQLTFRDDSAVLEYLNRKAGVHKWVVWVFGGIPIIGIVAAVILPMVANKKYTSPTDTLSVVPTCFATWNGRYFVRGRPQDEDKFLSIRFSMTVDSVFVPLHMYWTQKMLREQLVDIQKICPNIELPVEN